MPIVRAGLPKAVRARLDPAGRYGLRITLFATALILVAIPFSSLVLQVLAKGPITRWDARTANRLNAWVHDSPGAVRVFDLLSWFGKPLWFYLVVSAGCVFVWRRGRRRLALFLVVTCFGGGLVDSLVKLAVNRPRPVVDHPVATAFGKSFPSGHSMMSVVCYGALLLVFLPVLRRGAPRMAAVAGTVVWVLAIGCSRLLLGVHFVSDVVGGYVLGLAWLIGSVAVFEVWRVEQGKRPTQPLAEGVEPEAAPKLAVHAHQ